jgi:hypothetical protein
MSFSPLVHTRGLKVAVECTDDQCMPAFDHAAAYDALTSLLRGEEGRRVHEQADRKM